MCRNQFAIKWHFMIILFLFYVYANGKESIYHTSLNFSHKYLEHSRYKRQSGGLSSSQIDLNTTVPYIFSARLYPYGSKYGDKISEMTLQPFRLHTSLYFLERNYDTLFIHKDGIILLEPNFDQPPAILPLNVPLVAVYWMKTRVGKFYYRESVDANILSLAQNEVNIQYRYGNDFKAKSVVIITWEDSNIQKNNDETKNKNSNIFQVALILGENACFAHFVYSRLLTSGNAVAGFNGIADDESAAMPVHFSLPGSGTIHSAQLIEKSNIGIPGEWLFRIDEEKIYLCGAGFQGLECVDSCAPNQWYLDCSRFCHCADGNACNSESGECPNGKCNPGWEGSPICDQDIDECSIKEINCPNEQPDCVNTPGAYLCLCFEYDNITNTCKGIHSSVPKEQIPVPVMPLVPLLHSSNTQKSSFLNKQSTLSSANEQPFIKKHSHFSLLIAPSTIVPKFENNEKFELNNDRAFGVSSATTSQENSFGDKILTKIVENKLVDFSSFTKQLNMKTPVILATTLLPLTIRPILGNTHLSTQNSLLSSFDNNLLTVKNKRLKNECQRCHKMAKCVENECVCLSGFIGDGKNCEDVDECQAQDACGLHSECQNTFGSYQCVCDVGFVAGSNGCIDVDECNDGLVECPGGNSSICVNTIGGYECNCKSGFTGSPNTSHGCVDIDECELSLFYCGTKVKCRNTIGSYFCDCFDGYEISKELKQCVDMNECTHNPCDPNATCTNTDGSFYCECNKEYIGNGVECYKTILYPVIFQNATIITDASTLVSLNNTIVVFGKKYSSIYISPFGLISFDKPFMGMIQKTASELNSIALLPFHLMYNMTTSGAVTLQRYYDAVLHNEQLTKTSLTIQNKFNVPNFNAASLYVITFDQMHEINLEKPNTFQVLIIKGVDESTYAVFQYQNLDSIPRGIAGISSPAGFLQIPVENDDFISLQSNIGQAGRWIFRIDHPKNIIACPAGFTGAPYCRENCLSNKWGFNCENQCGCADSMPCDSHTGYCTNGKCISGYTGINCSIDIDECEVGSHKCNQNAQCTNLIGSYECKCNSGFQGDGFYCNKIDRCILRFGTDCAPNAHCDTTSIDLPECVCNNGFYGDGRRLCTLNSNRNDETIKKQPTTILTTEKAFVTTNKIISTQKTYIQNTVLINNSSNENNNLFNDRQQKLNFTFINKPIKKSQQNKKSNNFVNETFPENVITKLESDSSTETSGMFLIFGPIVFCVIWLLLVIIFLLICICKKQRARSEKYVPEMMGWSPRDYTSTRSTQFSQFAYT